VRLLPDCAVADDMFMRGFVPWRLFRELFVANGLKIVMTDGRRIGSFAAGGSLAGQSLAGQLPANRRAPRPGGLWTKAGSGNDRRPAGPAASCRAAG
jgi:hypothetical protein